VPMGDRIAWVVEEGKSVEENAPIVRLESREARQLDKELADTQVTEANQRLAAIIASGEKQIAEADLKVRQAKETEPLDIKAQGKKVELLKKQLKNVQDNLTRVRQLKDGTISKQEIERLELLVQQAEAELVAAEAVKERMELGHDLSVAGAEAQRATALATLERVKKEVPLASLELGARLAAERFRQTEVRAPVSGTVLKVLARKGEATVAAPVLLLADTRKIVAVAEVYETDAQRVRVGQEAKVESPALGGGPVPGKVVSVSRMVARNETFDLDPAATADRRVVKVKVLLEASEASEPAAHLINLQVSVAITTDPPDAP